PAQVGFAHAAGLCKLAKIPVPIPFAQDLERSTHSRVEGYSIAQDSPRALDAPTQQQQVMQPGIQPVRVTVVEGKRLEQGVQNTLPIMLLALQSLIGLGAAGLVDQRRLEDGYITLRIIR